MNIIPTAFLFVTEYISARSKFTQGNVCGVVNIWPHGYKTRQETSEKASKEALSQTPRPDITASRRPFEIFGHAYLTDL